ncbi:MAG: DNA-binding response regulator [Acidobacteria bacterium RIFCSPLOWO2_12_FULL_65_11]|nr:MAG: DNA-binding response regulator [Acidobacteria bacterium RIFCSPLOWO2_02_FULL_64_15]OFW34665.1 MAG: DNA-binding response regulator [Acidobacteria bacterium RIFCSPLOWO2_12_FULL_65_11]
MRILLVDDHPVVRQGIKLIVTDRWPDAAVGEADSAEAGLQQIQQDDWDVVVLDISMAGTSGLDLLKTLHHLYPRLPILVLSMHPASQFARRALSAGALGYLTKDSAPTALVDAILQVRRGHTYASAATRQALAEASDVRAHPHDVLSDREYQVLRMIGSGRTVSQIAASLALSVKTVSTYRARVLDKLGMTTNVELMRYVIENGLVEL